MQTSCHLWNCTFILGRICDLSLRVVTFPKNVLRRVTCVFVLGIYSAHSLCKGCSQVPCRRLVESLSVILWRCSFVLGSVRLGMASSFCICLAVVFALALNVASAVFGGAVVSSEYVFPKPCTRPL